MRMRKKPNLGPRMEQCRRVWIEAPTAYRGHWRSLMPAARELRVEVGCGKGKFTAETAQAEPDVLLIAIELDPNAMVMAMEKAVALGLTNVFFVAHDVAELSAMFAPDEIDCLYINFCDPWPRRKTAWRRLTYRWFLEQYKTALRLGGRIEFKTDNAPLFEFSLGEMVYCKLALEQVTRDLHANGPVGIMTGYEEKFYGLGTPINRCVAYVTTKEPVPVPELPKPKPRPRQAEDRTEDDLDESEDSDCG